MNFCIIKTCVENDMLLLPQTPWITLNGEDYADSQIIIGSSRGHFQTVQKLRPTNYFCFINFSSESIPVDHL